MEKNIIITANMISLGVLIINNMLDRVEQAKLNVLTKDIVQLHRNRAINASFDNLANGFYETLKAGPDEFVRIAQDELERVGNIDTFTDLRNKCPLIAYVLTGSIKVMGNFNLSCQPTGGRIHAAYVAAVQSLDDII